MGASFAGSATLRAGTGEDWNSSSFLVSGTGSILTEGCGELG